MVESSRVVECIGVLDCSVPEPGISLSSPSVFEQHSLRCNVIGAEVGMLVKLES